MSNHSESGDITVNESPYPYVISIPKLAILSITTFGLYEIYWFYRQFRSLKAEMNWNIYPVVRAIFSFLVAYSLFKRILALESSISKKIKLDAFWLAIAYFILCRLGQAPEPYWLISLLTFLPLIPIQASLNIYWEKKLGKRLVKSKFGGWNYFWVILGLIILLIAIYGEFFVDHQMVDDYFSSRRGQAN